MARDEAPTGYNGVEGQECLGQLCTDKARQGSSAGPGRQAASNRQTKKTLRKLPCAAVYEESARPARLCQPRRHSVVKSFRVKCSILKLHLHNFGAMEICHFNTDCAGLYVFTADPLRNLPKILVLEKL